MPSVSNNDEPIGFPVEPIDNCPHIPPTITLAVSTKSGCSVCEDHTENWQCLTCTHVFCSRYIQGHMQAHSQQATGHSVCLSYTDLSVWCNECTSYIKSKALEGIKRLAYHEKFGEFPPDSA
ncbi:hypothetical protein BDF14DRAFT_1881906 [Spinellus fusiger]|nr:hypothetical protein BDF14DRAFT_1881906 [Spinellus fusiger]